MSIGLVQLALIQHFTFSDNLLSYERVFIGKHTGEFVGCIDQEIDADGRAAEQNDLF